VPSYGQIFQAMGLIQGKRGNFAEAGAYLEKALALEPYNVAAHVNLGNVHLASNDHARAEAHYRSALQVDANEVSALVMLARVLAETGRGEAALPLLRRALALDRENQYARQLHRALTGNTEDPR